MLSKETIDSVHQIIQNKCNLSVKF